MNQVSSAFSRRSKNLLKKPAKNNTYRSKIKIPTLYIVDGIGVNRPAIVREIPHFGLFPAFPHIWENVPHFWVYFEIPKIAENRNNFSCTETFCSKKLWENFNNSITYAERFREAQLVQW